MSRWVVVGAGSAGCVVAGRLAARPDTEVVLVEAGPGTPIDPISDSFFDALAAPGRTYPELMATRVAGQPSTRYQRGRGLGGSGSVNALVGLDGGPYRADHLVPIEEPTPGELGRVDRALLSAAPDSVLAPLTRRDGRRVTTADAYLGPDLAGGRVEVVADTIVDRVLLVDSSATRRRAVGVLTAEGTTIDADRVVLAAGAIHTPAILLRSGVDVPGVGDGLQDHPSAPITLALGPDAIADPSSLVVGSLLSRDPIQILPMNHLGSDLAEYGLLLAALMRVESRGRVRLADADPHIDPIVEFDMLSHPADVAGVVAAVRAALDLLETDAFRSIVEAAYVDEHGTTAATLIDDVVIESWVRGHVGDYVHAASTCRIGVVLDERCRVVGHDGLMVCDASAFTAVPEVNTHIPVVMLAETMVGRWDD